MNFTNLVYFLTVAQERSFKSAAQKLFLSQQTLSEQINRLENEVGLPLFIRSKPLALTEAGEHFAIHAQEILKAKNKLEEDLQAMSYKQENRLTIAAPLVGPPPFITDLLSAFLSKELDSIVDLKKYSLDKPLNPFQECDLLFLPVPPPQRDISIVMFPVSHRAAVVSKSLLQRTWESEYDQKCKQLRESKSISDLVEIPMILFYNSKKQLEELVSHMEKYSFGPPIASISGNSSVCLAMCFSGMGGIIAPVDWIRNELQKMPKTKTDQLDIFPINKIAFIDTIV